MRVINPKPRTVNKARVTKLKAYMQDRESADFNELRANIPEFEMKTDGFIDQVCQDAEFEVSPE